MKNVPDPLKLAITAAVYARGQLAIARRFLKGSSNEGNQFQPPLTKIVEGWSEVLELAETAIRRESEKN